MSPKTGAPFISHNAWKIVTNCPILEAKTTKHGKNTPFFVTPNELRFSRNNASKYYLYRLFRFRESPRLFALNGRVEDWCILEPSEFIARPA